MVRSSQVLAFSSQHMRINDAVQAKSCELNHGYRDKSCETICETLQDIANWTQCPRYDVLTVANYSQVSTKWLMVTGGHTTPSLTLVQGVATGHALVPRNSGTAWRTTSCLHMGVFHGKSEGKCMHLLVYYRKLNTFNNPLYYHLRKSL